MTGTSSLDWGEDRLAYREGRIKLVVTTLVCREQEDEGFVITYLLTHSKVMMDGCVLRKMMMIVTCFVRVL